MKIRSPRRRGKDRGQSLVEFALVFPIFFVIMMGIIEFAFAFNAILSVNYASRDATLYAAVASSSGGADCVILAGIEADVKAPAKTSAITTVEIFRATTTGTQYSGGEITRFTRTGTLTCTMPDLTTKTVPYTRTTNGYPETDRCNVLNGCGGTHSSVDQIGVRIYYTHNYVTPLRTFVGTGPSFSFSRTNVMRMEPVL